MSALIKLCPCGTVLVTSQARAAVGKGKFCSKSCFYKYRSPRPVGLTYTITRDNPTSFKPGGTPWNKGKKT